MSDYYERYFEKSHPITVLINKLQLLRQNLALSDVYSNLPDDENLTIVKEEYAGISVTAKDVQEAVENANKNLYITINSTWRDLCSTPEIARYAK